MLSPIVFAWMEKACELVGIRVDAAHVRTFMQVTARADEGEVGELVTTTMLPSDDVVDLKYEPGGVSVRQAAVLATVTRTFTDKSADIVVDHARPCWRR
jgi:hypothetical protein